MPDGPEPTPRAGALLAVHGLETYYGKSHVLRGVSFEVSPGAITVLLGRNWGGQDDDLALVMGLTPPRAGHVRFKSHDITGQAPHRVFRLGIGYVPEGRQIFPQLDVGENLRLAQRPASEDRAGRWSGSSITFPSCASAGGSAAGASRAASSRCWPSPGPWRQSRAAHARRAVPGPGPPARARAEALMVRLKGEGVTLLLVEQNARMALAVSDHVLVLGKGTVVFAGPRRGFPPRAKPS